MRRVTRRTRSSTTNAGLVRIVGIEVTARSRVRARDASELAVEEGGLRAPGSQRMSVCGRRRRGPDGVAGVAGARRLPRRARGVQIITDDATRSAPDRVPTSAPAVAVVGAWLMAAHPVDADFSDGDELRADMDEGIPGTPRQVLDRRRADRVMTARAAVPAGPQLQPSSLSTGPRRQGPARTASSARRRMRSRGASRSPRSTARGRLYWRASCERRHVAARGRVHLVPRACGARWRRGVRAPRPEFVIGARGRHRGAAARHLGAVASRPDWSRSRRGPRRERACLVTGAAGAALHLAADRRAGFSGFARAARWAIAGRDAARSATGGARARGRRAGSSAPGVPTNRGASTRVATRRRERATFSPERSAPSRELGRPATIWVALGRRWACSKAWVGVGLARRLKAWRRRKIKNCPRAKLRGRGRACAVRSSSSSSSRELALLEYAVNLNSQWSPTNSHRALRLASLSARPRDAPPWRNAVCVWLAAIGNPSTATSCRDARDAGCCPRIERRLDGGPSQTENLQASRAALLVASRAARRRDPASGLRICRSGDTVGRLASSLRRVRGGPDGPRAGTCRIRSPTPARASWARSMAPPSQERTLAGPATSTARASGSSSPPLGSFATPSANVPMRRLRG